VSHSICRPCFAAIFQCEFEFFSTLPKRPATRCAKVSSGTARGTTVAPRQTDFGFALASRTVVVNRTGARSRLSRAY
jgi:hypothetical protein